MKKVRYNLIGGSDQTRHSTDAVSLYILYIYIFRYINFFFLPSFFLFINYIESFHRRQQ